MADALTADRLRTFLAKTPQPIFVKGPDGLNRVITSLEVTWADDTNQPPAFLTFRTT